ncbi:MAG: class I SAM-dependent methyltransferase [Arenimonas sp.]
MSKQYDAAYFGRWYRGHHATPRAALARKVAMAVAVTEYYLQRPIRSVLDIGCGEAAWRAPLLALRPRLHYRGVDSSEYAVARYGRSRNIALARFGQLEQLRFGAPADLLVCSDVIHYVPTTELRRGLAGFNELCDGLAFLELYARGDDIRGDREGFLARPAASYRRWFREAGFIACGSHAYLSPNLHANAVALEVLESKPRPGARA